ncbi:MAG: FAD-dependent oxidoreductase, partial [Pseudomonadota bacterium]
MTSLSRSIETMRNSQDQNALIVGAGIGGLTTALALQAHGWRVRVIEKAPELSEVGAGIQISPNASRVLRALDLLEPLMDVSVTPTRIEMVRGIDGKPVFSVPAGSAAAVRWGAPYLH